MSLDAEIARRAQLLPIEAIGAKAGIPEAALYRYGPFMAKLDHEFLASLPPRRGKLILVTAISPTPAGEGKTTTTIGLGDALNRSGRETIICLREPSLGPCFGLKGGATGGGRAQVVPMDKINLHFTGDFHALTSANNLLAALIDNHVFWSNRLEIDPGRISWRRALDMNDRALRETVVGLGGHGPVREDGFDITVASETMAAFCLASSLKDLEARLGRMIVGRTRSGHLVTASDLKAAPGMAALLRDALQPNMVQTLDHSPALVHGGPFANIAHGCNSVIATDAALRLADYVVTEAGFGADLGAEKFCDIKCRSADLTPAACVVVATVRALKMHGGVFRADLARENQPAVVAGFPNLARHIENMRKFGLPVTVAINHFSGDTPGEIDRITEACHAMGVTSHLCRHWAEGGAGALTLADEVATLASGGSGRFRMLYDDTLPLAEKIRAVARGIYRARDVVFGPLATRKLKTFEAEGFGNLSVCMAKTQYSFSADPHLMGAPEGFDLPVRDLRLSAGAGFVVAICGDIMTMPGLPRVPAAERIGVSEDGTILGLF